MAAGRDKPRHACPLCGGSVYAWIGVPVAASEASVGLPSPVDPDDPDGGNARLVDRCERCGAGIERGPGHIDLIAELDRIEIEGPEGTRTFAAPNRASWQGSLGGDGWAALAEWPGRLLLTPRAFALLAEKNGLVPDKAAFPPAGPNQRWLWQSILNGITLHHNFLTEVRAGRLRVANSRGPLQYAADMLASCLATPFVLLVSFPLEAIASLAGRGGRMIVRAREASGSGEGVGDLDDERRELAGAVEVR
jgi:hypothetical protein